MGQESNEATRVMPSSGPPMDRTMVAGEPPPAGATQMGATIVCAVCQTSNSALETYCNECGFLLSSTPGEVEPGLAEEAAGMELVEASTGRRFRLRAGVNTIGREHCDILLMDGTVSRRHAQISVENGAATVTDLGSTNGTQVDGSRLIPSQPVALAPGTIVRFGNATFTFLAPGGQAGATIVAAPPAEPTIVASASPPPIDQTLVSPPPPAAPPEAPPAPLAEAAVEESPAPMTATEGEAPVARLKPTREDLSDILIRPGTIRLGRRPGNDVLLSQDPYVSGRHAEIFSDNTGCYLTDLGSTNGTVVNGQRLEPGQRQLLLDGDAVTLGQSGYVFETLDVLEQEIAPSPPLQEAGAEAWTGAEGSAQDTPNRAEIRAE